MSKYLYATVYEEFTGLKPPEPTDNKQRRKRGYGHPYRMRLNMQEEAEVKQKKSERRNQFGQPINSSRKNRDERDEPQISELPPQFNAARKPRQERQPHQNYNAGRATDQQKSAQIMSMPQERKGSAMPKVTYKKRRSFNVEQLKAHEEESA